MKIVAITNIHGRQDYTEKIIGTLKAADLMLIAGDITNFGGEKEANAILDILKKLNKNILAVSGNCDRDGVNSALMSLGFNLHGEIKQFKHITLFGLCGSNKTPLHTPQEYNESDMELVLNKFKKIDTTQYYIFVTHSPPVKTKLDKIFWGGHVGSKVVRNFIEKFQPDLVICGHIHEARGVDTIGKTLVINPGPFPRHYAIITCTESIDYELY